MIMAPSHAANVTSPSSLSVASTCTFLVRTRTSKSTVVSAKVASCHWRVSKDTSRSSTSQPSLCRKLKVLGLRRTSTTLDPLTQRTSHVSNSAHNAILPTTAANARLDTPSDLASSVQEFAEPNAKTKKPRKSRTL
jgi:hypothetical protein